MSIIKNKYPLQNIIKTLDSRFLAAFKVTYFLKTTPASDKIKLRKSWLMKKK
jgi:hypothetical protein